MEGRRRGPGSGLKAAALLLGLALITTGQALAVSPTISVDSVTSTQGDEATVNLEAIDIGAPGLAAWTIDVAYDPAVVTPVACNSYGVGVCNVEFAPDKVRVTGASASGLLGDTVLASITFECTESGSTTLTPVVDELGDATPSGPQEISAAVDVGGILCVAGPATLRGDANCDGLVNSIDAAIVLQFVAGLIDSVPCPANADVDGNGRIDAIDAALILQIDAGLWTAAA